MGDNLIDPSDTPLVRLLLYLYFLTKFTSLFFLWITSSTLRECRVVIACTRTGRSGRTSDPPEME